MIAWGDCELAIINVMSGKGKRIMERIRNAVRVGMVGLMGVLAPALAFATPPSQFTLPELPMGQMYTLGGTILGGLAVMWVLRKIVKTTNRS